MGKNLIQQARGKGSTTYRAPSFNYKGRSMHAPIAHSPLTGTVTEIMHCCGHSAPLIKVKFDGKEDGLMVAPEHIRVGDTIAYGTQEIKTGNCLKLGDMPEGTIIFNIEMQPGDGGKLVRAGGSFAKVLSKYNDKIIVLLPSKKQKEFQPDCRASIGAVAGSGRPEKPMLKAGTAFHKYQARNKLWPLVSGTSCNAIDHPFGGGSSARKGRPTIAPRFAPPGRKVGMLKPRKSGRAKTIKE
jgi:large subunit ribosomal protein L2